MSGAMIAGGMGVASAAIGSSGGKGGGGDAAASAPQMYDPFAKERQKYVKQLGSFMQDPSALYGTESYKARLKAGQQGVASSSAAKGLLDSGAMGVELMQQGQTFASEEYDKEYQRLAQLAGVGIDPSWSSGFEGPRQGAGGGLGSLAGELSEFPWDKAFGGGSPTAGTAAGPGPATQGGFISSLGSWS